MSFKKYLTEQKSEYPNGVYMALRLSEKSYNELFEYMETNLKGIDLNPALHCTLIYSAKKQTEKVIVSDSTFLANSDHFDKFDNETALVLKLKSDGLQKRNEELTKQYGFISDFSEYTPHITLSYDAKSIDVDSLPLFKGIIELENEYTEDIYA